MNYVNSDGDSALFRLCSYGTQRRYAYDDTKFLKLLLSHGANLGLFYDGESVFDRAAFTGKRDVMWSMTAYYVWRLIATSSPMPDPLPFNDKSIEVVSLHGAAMMLNQVFPRELAWIIIQYLFGFEMTNCSQKLTRCARMTDDSDDEDNDNYPLFTNGTTAATTTRS